VRTSDFLGRERRNPAHVSREQHQGGTASGGKIHLNKGQTIRGEDGRNLLYMKTKKEKELRSGDSEKRGKGRLVKNARAETDARMTSKTSRPIPFLQREGGKRTYH